MRTVLLITGHSGGDALGGIGRSYATLFKTLGVELIEIDVTDPAAAFSLLDDIVHSRPVEFAIGMMGVGAQLCFNDEDGRVGNLWEGGNIPFLSLYGDSPAYFFDRHVARSTLFAGIYGFPEHLALRRRLPMVNGFLGCTPPVMVDLVARENVDFRAKERGALLFLKNGNDPAALRRVWMETMQAAPLQALLAIADQLESDIAGDAANQIDDVVCDYFTQRGMEIGQMVKLRLFFIAQLDDYLRRLKANMMARALMAFPVQIRGTGWDHLNGETGRATLVPDGDYKLSRGLISECLGLLDMSPNTSLAPHDRVMRAFGSYSFCLTNEQEFLRKDVKRHAAMSFRFGRDELQAKVADVLARPADHVALGAEIAEDYRATHPPEAGIARMIEIAGMLRLERSRTTPAGMPRYFVWPPARLA